MINEIKDVFSVSFSRKLDLHSKENCRSTWHQINKENVRLNNYRVDQNKLLNIDSKRLNKNQSILQNNTYENKLISSSILSNKEIVHK